jgi:hypothetical protein
MGTLRLHRHGAPPLEVTQDRVLVGRDPSCEMVIEDKSVSRRHAYFERRGQGWAIVDQGSANGTFINGAQVMEADLQDGQELRLGMVPLRVEMESAMAGTVLMQSPVQGTVLMPSGGVPPLPPPAAAAPAAWGAHQPAYAAPAQAAYAPPPPAPAYEPPPAYAPPASPYAQPAAPAYAPSPQDEAAALLGVHPRATPEEVKARYTELAGDLETKLANARTPHLKTTYQRNLDELRKAAEVLSPGFTDVDVADLPAAAPTVVPHEMDISMPEAVRMMGEKPPAAAEPKAGLPPASAVAIGFMAMGMLAMIAFFNLSAGKINKQKMKDDSDPAIVKEQNDAITYKSVAALAEGGILNNGALKLCNKGTQTYQVAWMGAVYAGKSADTGKVVLNSFNSGWCGADLNLTVPVGTEQSIDVRGSDPRCRWDGKGLFYSITFKHPTDPEKQIRIAGPLHSQTACINIGEGW